MGIVAITTSSFGKVSEAPLQRLKHSGYEVRLNPHGRKITPAETIELLQDVVGVVAGTEKYSRDLLKELPQLKVISRVGAGVDAIDHDAAKDAGVSVFNTPTAHVHAVAELAVGGLLSVARNLGHSDRAIRSGTWKKNMGRLVGAMTVGVIGFGRVGQATAKLLAGFGCKVMAFDVAPNAELAKEMGVELALLERLLAESDALSLHVPGQKEQLLGAEQFQLMKPDAILVNTARGGIVDEAALFSHLKENPGAGAYIDCYANEPYSGELAKLDNVLLSPHIGSYAREGRLDMESGAVENLLVELGKAS